jgi:hypothetical protein
LQDVCQPVLSKLHSSVENSTAAADEDDVPGGHDEL